MIGESICGGRVGDLLGEVFELVAEALHAVLLFQFFECGVSGSMGQLELVLVMESVGLVQGGLEVWEGDGFVVMGHGEGELLAVGADEGGCFLGVG